jgi:hypothetical protein
MDLTNDNYRENRGMPSRIQASKKKWKEIIQKNEAKKNNK